MTVKGTRLYPMTVVPVRPHARLKWMLLGVLLLVGTGVGAWEASRYALMRVLGGETDGPVDLAERAQQLAEENARLRKELAVYRIGGDVTRQVEENVRSDNRALQDRVAELEQAIADYRTAIVPDTDGKGLRIERLEFTADSEPGLWHWKLMLLRTGGTDGAMQGNLEGRVTWQGPSGPVVTSIIPEGSQPFSVRYARQFQGDFRLPAGATLQRGVISAVITAPRVDRVERSWGRVPAPRRTQEASANAGQG